MAARQPVGWIEILNISRGLSAFAGGDYFRSRQCRYCRGAIRSGAYDYIEKPFKTDKLLVTVARAIEGVCSAKMPS